MAGEFPNTLKFLNKYGSEVEREIGNRLAGHGKIATGKLYESVRYEIRENGHGLILTFKMADYGKYVDKGIKPSKYANSKGKGTGNSPFIKALMKWCQIQGIDKNRAFPIRRHIWKYGLPPTNFFTIPTTRRKKQLEQGIKKNMALDYEEQLTKDFKHKKRGN